MSPGETGAASRIEAALSAAGDLAYEWDLATDRLTWLGDAASLALPELSQLATGAALRARISPEDLALRQHRLDRHLESGAPYECEYRLIGAAGEPVWVQDRGAATREAAEAARMSGILRRIGARKEQERRIEQLENFDELTGLFNKRRLRGALDELLRWGARAEAAGAYLVVGIDNMTMLNDAFGHDAADEVLVETARRLERCLGLTDVIGRVGGDRFGLFFAQCGEEKLAATAERLLAAISQAPVFTRSGPIYVTVSVGSVLVPDQAVTADEAMSRAESALASAKRAGRDCISPYRLAEEQRREHRAAMAVGERVQRALKQDHIVFAFQPVVDADSGLVDYYECLLRMVAEDGRIVSAGEFIPAVEQLGFIRMVDRFVLERAVEEVAATPGLRLGFNVSGVTATDHAWLRVATELLRDQPQIASRLVVEITETATVGEFEDVVRFVKALRELGCRVGLDDFGAGYTSLRHLKALPIDTVKIDGSFIRNLSDNYDNQVFLRHLLGLANGFGLTTVAECVERAQDAAILRREGVSYLQGYYFGRPSIVRPWGTSPAALAHFAPAAGGLLLAAG
jgi:diguanylate cyclase (GGDEF)-like protein